jgi:hypothetical protein
VIRFLRSLLLLSGLVLYLAAPALGAGPVLDPSFGAGGRVTGSAPQNAVFTGFASGQTLICDRSVRAE